MTDEEARRANIGRLVQRAREALHSARSELASGRMAFAMNRAYYACFYISSAVLLGQGRHFVKHAGLRAGLHRDLVKTGRLDAQTARIFDDLMVARHEGDYGPVDFSSSEIELAIEHAESFVEKMAQLLPRGEQGRQG